MVREHSTKINQFCTIASGMVLACRYLLCAKPILFRAKQCSQRTNCLGVANNIAIVQSLFVISIFSNTF